MIAAAPRGLLYYVYSRSWGMRLSVSVQGSLNCGRNAIANLFLHTQLVHGALHLVGMFANKFAQMVYPVALESPQL